MFFGFKFDKFANDGERFFRVGVPRSYRSQLWPL